MRIDVKNFGKIKNASVNIEGFTVFVGDNNSGKTFLMQLIYGVIEALVSRLAIVSQNNSFKEQSLSEQELKEIVNSWLNREKENIVLKTFKKRISIGSLTIDFSPRNRLFSIQRMSVDEFNALHDGEDRFDEDMASRINYIFALKENDVALSYHIYLSEMKDNLFIQNELLRFAIGCILDCRGPQRCIFLPASRSGLMQTRQFVFANREKMEIQAVGRSQKLNRIEENEFGLTQPVYDFLKFLQKHKVSEEKSDERESLIAFINTNIIHGKLKKTDNETFYQPDGSEEWFPPSVTSSMVNEISPIMQVITSIVDCSYVFYDEIETCQHPITQIQMARLMNRLVNVGYKMIVSTHSDTMAAAISNLVALSFSSKKEILLSKLNLQKEDLLKNDCIRVYQFEKTEDGSSNVVELEKFDVLGMGFDFTSFSRVSNKVYNDAKIIYGEL